MALTAALLEKNSLKLNCSEPGVGSRNAVMIRVHEDKNGNWRKIDFDKWRHTWRPITSRSILGPKTRPMEIARHVPGEEDRGSIPAEEPSERI